MSDLSIDSFKKHSLARLRISVELKDESFRTPKK